MHFCTHDIGLTVYITKQRGQATDPVSPSLTCPLRHLSSFKNCIPRSFREHIRQHNVLTRLRLRRVFRRFLRAFQPGHLSQQVVMVKYLATLERLAPRFGSEHIPVCHLEVVAQPERDPCYLQNSGQTSGDPGPELVPGPPTHEVLVTGTGGIQWRPLQRQVSSLHSCGLLGVPQGALFSPGSGGQSTCLVSVLPLMFSPSIYLWEKGTGVLECASGSQATTWGSWFLSFHCVGSRKQTGGIRLWRQASLPVEPAHWPLRGLY